MLNNQINEKHKLVEWIEQLEKEIEMKQNLSKEVENTLKAENAHLLD